MSAELDSIAALRPRLFGLAYRMLGSRSQAEDMVQETFVRWYAKPRPEVDNEAAYLTSTITHLCLDHLKRASTQREHYVGEWLPEPLLTDAASVQAEWLPGADMHNSEDNLEQLQTISLAFLAVLDSLSPLERAVYLLHEVFDYDHAEVARLLDRSPAACRQTYHRAKKSLQHRRPALATPAQHRQLLEAFLSACQRGNLEELTGLLAADATSCADGGGKVTAASRTVKGARAIARLFLGFYRQPVAGLRVKYHDINGWPALLVCTDDILRSVTQIQTDGKHIQEIHTVLNPDKLREVAHALGMRVAGEETEVSSRPTR